MICVHCKKENLFLGKTPFRATCEQCGQALHSCVQCRYYCVGKPNDCLVPGTEWIQDRVQENRCDEFAPGGLVQPKGPSMKEVEKKLFRTEDGARSATFSRVAGIAAQMGK